MIFVLDVGRAVGSNPSKVGRSPKETKGYFVFMFPEKL
jgi:hypothetical protein